MRRCSGASGKAACGRRVGIGGHRCRRASGSWRCSASMIQDVLGLVEGNEMLDARGRQALENACASLPAPKGVTEASLSKTWKLVFTTEKVPFEPRPDSVVPDPLS